ncbi:2OG-Fe dioxygenase family protein [Streptomyces sp. NPDC050355]|uniref:2OG-Fe dioxygenase family protein n=1 Tax=Streptomyces sp. NPDC050355 TaxID=3365609 RepID=UPI0037B3C1AE
MSVIAVLSAAPAVAAAVRALTNEGCHVVPAQQLSQLIGVEGCRWARFARHWEELTLDRFMGDGGTYRLRRYGEYRLVVQSGELVLSPHGPFVQQREVNPLNGGVERHLDPLTTDFTGEPLLRDLLVSLGRIFAATTDGTDRWRVKVHPFRISAGHEVGLPTPEGRHRDGVTFIASLLIDRQNIGGGESTVYDHDGRTLLTTSLTEPGDLLLGDDRRTLHSVTPVHRRDATAAAHRDVLVMAYTVCDE